MASLLQKLAACDAQQDGTDATKAHLGPDDLCKPRPRSLGGRACRRRRPLRPQLSLPAGRRALSRSRIVSPRDRAFVSRGYMRPLDATAPGFALAWRHRMRWLSGRGTANVRRRGACCIGGGPLEYACRGQARTANISPCPVKAAHCREETTDGDRSCNTSSMQINVQSHIFPSVEC